MTKLNELIEKVAREKYYKSGDKTALTNILRSKTNLQNETKILIADILDEKISVKQKKRRPPNTNKMIDTLTPLLRHEVEVLTKWYKRKNKRMRKLKNIEKKKHRKTPAPYLDIPIQLAITTVAARWHLTPGLIDHIYYPRKRNMSRQTDI